MNDQTYIWILIYVVMALVLVLGALVGRRWRSAVVADPQARYRYLRGVCIFYALLCGLQLFAAFHSKPPLTWKNFAAPAAMLGCLGIFLFQFLQARKRWRASAEFKSQPPPKPAPFFWQAVFILLPVILLAGFGLFSLRQDRLLVEQEAKQSAELLAQRIAKAVATDGGNFLRDYRNNSSSLAASDSTVLGLSGWSGGEVSRSNELQRIENWQRANPEINLSALPPAGSVGYEADRPLPMPPSPSEWLAQLDTRQQSLWQTLQQAALSSRDETIVSNLVETFLATKPPKGARANARYLLLLAQARNLPPAEAVLKIADYSWTNWGNSGELSDAGLPLGQLICYQALKRLPDGAGLPKNFIRHNAIAWTITYAPSVFSPALISETERVARGTAQEQNAATLRAWWNSASAARQVMDDFEEQHPTNTWKVGAFWVDSRNENFLVLLGDRRAERTNAPPIESLVSDRVVLPMAVLQKATAHALRQSGISVPAYALARIEMVSRAINLPAAKEFSDSAGKLPTLGESSGEFDWFYVAEPEFQFRVVISLANPQALYARQNLRNWMFGALIVLSLAAAVLALLAARRAFQRQLALNEQKSNFVSSVSHELRAPIASVRLMAENLERGKISGAEKQNEYFRFIVQECRRLSALIENVLDFSRIEQGRKQYEFEPTNLIALTETTVKLMEPYAAEKGVNLKLETFNLQPSTFNLELDVDGRAIQQALVNLIDNAIKHSAKGETVSVEIQNEKLKIKNVGCEDEGRERGRDVSQVTHHASLVTLSVSDHGPGIPAAEQEKIFERFYRLGSELRRETQGVGIGLSVVKHIVEAHGGRVIVQSEVGKGSTFTIELPGKI